ncbi:MAG: hypothetical protein BGO51_15065 [Rhodospirillales bacterium 69-11]|nr:hypothetical protein [Rhodospirillales bacterium]OJW19445.1 MAG: hypothetical protein BGO51_15065 [Rhodospirillales bacterium 69-11]
MCRTSRIGGALFACALAFAAAMPVTGHAQGNPPAVPATFAFKSPNVDLPNGDRMFTGAGSDAINNNCLACHSAGMVLNQPPLSKAAWDAEVHKMIQVYKAPVNADDIPAIVAYLAANKGTK